MQEQRQKKKRRYLHGIPGIQYALGSCGILPSVTCHLELDRACGSRPAEDRNKR
jgi:hypothetical protein